VKIVNIIVAAALVGGWTVTHEKDRMTDKALTWASAQSGEATLLVGCLNGTVQPRLAWSQRKGFGAGIGVSWRIDNGPVQMHAAGLFSQAGDVLYAWPTGLGLSKAKRLRVSVGGDVLDFDLVKGEALPQQWGC
jgi:hypothetical protein